MLYLPIKKAWIVSRVARRLYLICAVLAMSLFGGVIASRMALTASGVASFSASQAAVLLIRILLWPGIVATALLSIAMWYFWFGFDNSGWIRKTAWFLPLYLLLGIGPALYYFFVYRRNAEVANS
jgi:hypothetical protein